MRAGMRAVAGQAPGRGGINRGRADAEMTWGDESTKQGVRFKEMEIPQGVPDRDGELLRSRLTEPQADPVAPSGRAAARTSTETVGGEAAKQNLRPRHREVIKKYFGSGEK